MKKLLQYGLLVAVTAAIAACGGGGDIPLYIPTSSALTVTTTSLPAATIGKDYNQTLTATGGVLPYKWSIMSGALPLNLTLSATGAITGNPTTAGKYDIQFMVTDGNPSQPMVHQQLSITVAAAGSPLTVTTNSLPNATVGTAYNQTLSASGGVLPYNWSIMSGSLPLNLTLSATGAITGTPTTAGTYDILFMVTDGNPLQPMVHKQLTITVNAAAPLPGKAVYDNNCAVCHQLGAYDPSGSPNLSGQGSKVPTKFPTAGVAGHKEITLSAQQITDVAAFLNAN